MTMPTGIGFKNPIGAGLHPARIDMGVDYTGSGPLYALGDGTVINIAGHGWPGGTFLAVKLTTGQIIYYAEDIQPLVRVGQHVTAGQHIANATGGSTGIEVGWAANGQGTTMAAANHQQNPNGDPGAFRTAFGQNMSDLIHSLGGPAGIGTGAIHGTVPSTFGQLLGKNNALGGSGSALPGGAGGPPTATEAEFKFPNPLNFLGGIWHDISGAPSTIGDMAQSIEHLSKNISQLITWTTWLFNPANWLRVGAALVGLAVLLGGLFFLAKAAG